MITSQPDKFTGFVPRAQSWKSKPLKVLGLEGPELLRINNYSQERWMMIHQTSFPLERLVYRYMLLLFPPYFSHIVFSYFPYFSYISHISPILFLIFPIFLPYHFFIVPIFCPYFSYFPHNVLYSSCSSLHKMHQELPDATNKCNC